GSCQTGYTLCQPAGATSINPPSIGSDGFQNLLTDLLASQLPALKRADGTASLCCISSLSCLTLANLALPFCYDKFTTNFLLPDNSFGTVATGSYTSSNGDTANLISGDYTLANGQAGNIYSGVAKPNTATLALPSQFTASGVGSAVPATALGGVVTLTYTTSLPGSTFPATTVSPTTLPGSTYSSVITVPITIASTVGGSVSTTTAATSETTVSTAAPSTIAGTTREASTAPGTVATLTTTQAVPVSSSASASVASASASETKKSAASSLQSEKSAMGVL
ncbi:hypothetical protein BJ875DRAFT_362422, partial [Amylocarpus encephaloides]